jgi:hypothetical protein
MKDSASPEMVSTKTLISSMITPWYKAITVEMLFINPFDINPFGINQCGINEAFKMCCIWTMSSVTKGKF